MEEQAIEFMLGDDSGQLRSTHWRKHPQFRHSGPTETPFCVGLWDSTWVTTGKVLWTQRSLTEIQGLEEEKQSFCCTLSWTDSAKTCLQVGCSIWVLAGKSCSYLCIQSTWLWVWGMEPCPQGWFLEGLLLSFIFLSLTYQLAQSFVNWTHN